MQRSGRAAFAGLLLALLLGVSGRASALETVGRPLHFWTVAKSETWAGTPSPVNRYMATVGLSELSSGLQSSGFRGAAGLNWVNGGFRPGVSRTITLTALKARIVSVTQRDQTVLVQVKPEPKGYELVAVDVSAERPGNQLTFVFIDPTAHVMAREKVLIE